MSSPVVIETVRTIPLIIENEPMDIDKTGFPFDRAERTTDDDTHFRSQLDDLAKRHPEFAEHLEGFRSRRATRDDPELRRFRERPFGSASRFERFGGGFPFDREEFFEEPHFQQHQEVPPQHFAPPPAQPQQPPTESHQTQTEELPPQPEQQHQEPKRQQNIQQSNTVDLGQKQEPEVNDRQQRSMSAPPDNRQRFVSSINIPVNMDQASNQQQQQQQPAPQQQQQSRPTERVIPIHVEGRDEPVLPKGPHFVPHQQPQPERVFGGTERVFGHRPQYSGFMNRGFGPEREERFQQHPPPHPQQHPPQPPPKPQQQQQQSQPQPQQQQQQQQAQSQPQPQPQPEPPSQPQPSKAPTTPIEVIQAIQKDVSALMEQVEKFEGQPRDKTYLYLDEMLTRNLIKLDNIDTQGQENIRLARREAIKCIQSCIGILEAKAAANAQQLQQDNKQQETMEVENKEDANKMEVAESKQEEENKENVAEPAPAPVQEAVATPAVLVTEEMAEPPSEVKAEENKTGDKVKGEAEGAEAPKEEAKDSKEEKKKGKKKVIKNK